MQWREQWQLIDFDATVRIGMPAGSKHSVACAPPELLEDIGGRIAPILSTATNALLAHPGIPAEDPALVWLSAKMLQYAFVNEWNEQYAKLGFPCMDQR